MLFRGRHWVLLCLHNCRLRPLIVTRCCWLNYWLIHHIASSWNYNTTICKHLPNHHLIKVSRLSLWWLLGNLRVNGIWAWPPLRVRNHIITKEVSLYKSIWGTWRHKVLVVLLTTSWWVNSHKIVFSYLFLKGFPDNISIAAINLRNSLE